MQTIPQIALIGPTASGKSDLAIHIAKRFGGIVLSLDSLAIYKQIDIASAKPSIEERDGITHYGIDLLYPDEHFDVSRFLKLYTHAYEDAYRHAVPLIIVGGTSFYLKVLIEGISPMPTPSKTTRAKIADAMRDTNKLYAMLCKIDPVHMAHIEASDRYRIEKAATIYFETGQRPSDYFAAHPPHTPLRGSLPIYEIATERAELRQRIAKRTRKMLQAGLIDEVVALEARYTRSPNAMKAIGIKETLAYLDGIYDKAMLYEKIVTHTARLAKRQNTFNKTQFKEVIRADSETLQRRIAQTLQA